MMQKNLLALLLPALFLWLAAPGLAAERHGDAPLGTQWQAFTLGQAARSKTGLESTRLLVLFLEPDQGWYTYARNPGDTGKPTILSVGLAGGPQNLDVLYPHGTPKKDLYDPSITVNAYLGRTPLFIPLPPGAGRGPFPLQVTAALDMLLCTKDKCLPTRLDLKHRLPSLARLPEASAQDWFPLLLKTLEERKAPQPGPPAAAPGPGAAALTAPDAKALSALPALKPRYLQPALEVGGLAKAVLFGMLAGLLLNFMPCALPVISLKLSSLLAGSGGALGPERTAKVREHFLFLALGAMLYFALLSALFGLTDLAWGQIFQKPEVVLGLTLVVFALSLSLLGVFSLPVIDLKFDQMTTHPRLQSLFTGLLTTLLATPCSGPFLGGVLGWALLQPPVVISTVLLSIGLGMASPYLLLCAAPSLARFTPRPGPWTRNVERGVALFLMGTCIYLLNILPKALLIPALVLLLLTAAASWLWGAAGLGFDTTKSRVLKPLALLLVAAGLAWALHPQPRAPWERYASLELAQSLGTQNVLVDFTADWCPTCKVLEQTNLTPTRLADWKARYNLRLMKADLTERNPEAEALLHALGGKSIPLLAIFPKNAPDSPLVLRDLFTPGQLEDALSQTSQR